MILALQQQAQRSQHVSLIRQQSEFEA